MAPRVDGLSGRARSAYDQFLQAYGDIPITSAYRDPAYNAKVGGAKGSAHVHGDAMDFSVRGLDEAQKAEVVNWWRQQGATGLGYYPNSDSIHVDLREGPNRAWGPNYSHTSLGKTPEWFQAIAAEHRGAPGDTYTKPLQTGDATMAGYPSSVGGLGGLGGYQPQEDPGLFSKRGMGDVLQAVGMSLMGSPSNSPLSGFGQAYGGIEDRRERQQESAADRETWAAALGAMGLPQDQAAMFARNPKAAGMVLEQQREQRAQAQAQASQNRTADWAEQQGFTDIAEAIRSGAIDGTTGWKAVQDRMNAGSDQFRMLTAEEAQEYGLDPSKAYQIGPDQKVSAVGGGGQNININTGSSSDDFYKKADEKRAESFIGIADAGMEAQRKLARVGQLEQVLGNVETGGLASIKSAAGEWGINTEGLSDIQAAQALINTMVPEQRPPGSGTMSDADLALFKASLPRIINQPGGNQTILKTIRDINQYDLQMGDIANKVINREITPAEGSQMMREVANPLAGFSGGSAGAPAPTGGLTPGNYRYNPETGQMEPQ
ncbi:YcbK family protein [Aurantimonas coralicida]|uniref:YcbK family protein n=1 Tax=Aurantimonas coralicida TaxID=182270 RepID=UPI001E569AE5|nr:D-Ala-D-Ala carboxypeptidase family metallohydrolase [Aurantimonas coralicida]MCD1644167.1 DUF882 domain-containing protein [Aurantimonas coralicida]